MAKGVFVLLVLLGAMVWAQTKSPAKPGQTPPDPRATSITADVYTAVRQQLAGDFQLSKQQIKSELKQELRSELKQELKMELKQELRMELKMELQQELRR